MRSNSTLGPYLYRCSNCWRQYVANTMLAPPCANCGDARGDLEFVWVGALVFFPLPVRQEHTANISGMTLVNAGKRKDVTGVSAEGAARLEDVAIVGFGRGIATRGAGTLDLKDVDLVSNTLAVDAPQSRVNLRGKSRIR